MIKINDKEYKNYEIEVEYDNFSATTYGVKREGISPIIKLLIDDKILIRVETVLSKDIVSILEDNSCVDITKFISDISYEDEKGWVSIIDENLSCKLIGKDKYELLLSINNKLEEMNLDIDIKINLFDQE